MNNYIQNDKNTKNVIYRMQLSIFLLAILFLLCGCKDEKSSSLVQIADQKFVIPPEFKYWKYTHEVSADMPPYDQLRFTVDVDTFKTIKSKYGKEIKNQVELEIRPLASEFGEKYYWTKRDPVYDSKPFNCKSYGKYKVCEHKTKNQISSFADSSYSIRDAESGEYLSMFGCMNKEKYKNLNIVCNSRAKLPGNIEVEYSYRHELFSRAFEIDQKVRDLVLSLYQR